MVSSQTMCQPSNRSSPAEIELVRRLRAGDEAAFEALVREQTPRLHTVANRILRHQEDACDAVQEAFMQAFRSIDRFKGDSQLTTWLHRIVLNAALMKLRARRRRGTQPIEALLPQFVDDGHRVIQGQPWQCPAITLLQQRETRAIVRSCIDRLPASHREVLLLRDIEELNTAATAELLGIAPGAVKTRLHRARMALRELLEQELVM